MRSAEHEKEIALDGPTGDSGCGAIRLPRGRACKAAVELDTAAAVRLAHAQLLASAGTVGAVPDFVRRLGRLGRGKGAHAPSHERTHGRAHGGTDERTVGKDDARRTREIPPRGWKVLGPRRCRRRLTNLNTG